MPELSTQIAAPRFHHVWGGVLQRIFVLNATQAWTAEEGGRIRRTQDGGATWQFQSTPNEIDGYVRSVFFLRRGPSAGQVGWAVGSNGRLIATTNGGATWSLVGAPLTYPADDPRAGLPTDLWDVYFQDGQVGWVAGIRVLRRTLDGGQTWIDLMPLNPSLPTSAEFYRLTFLSQSPAPIAVAVAEPGLIVRSVDGTNWTTALVTPDFCAGLPDGIELWDVQFQPSASPGTAVGYVVGGQGNQCGGMLSSADGGATWVRESSATLPPTVYGVTPLAGMAAIACTYGGRAFVRNSAVAPQWMDISALLEPPLATLRVPMWGAGSDGGSTAWIVGLMNTAYKTSDGGESWTRQLGAGAWRMRDVHFIDANTGWAVAQEVTVLRSSDGGATWSEEIAERGPTLNSIRMRDSTHGVAVGNPSQNTSPAIYFYDAAQLPHVWRASRITAPPIPPPPNPTLWSTVWTSAATNQAWAVGTKGVVMRCSDGTGQNWSYFQSPPGTSAVDFLSITFDGIDALYTVGVRRTTGEACAFRLRYPALVWEDLSPGLLGTWRAVAAQGATVYVAGSISPTEGVVYLFDPGSLPGSPIWNVVQPVRGAAPLQVLMTASIVGRGVNQTLFVGGERGAVLRLQNGVWSALKSQTSVTLTGMSFLSPTRGFAVGHGSLDGQGVGSSLGLGDSALVGYA